MADPQSPASSKPGPGIARRTLFGAAAASGAASLAISRPAAAQPTSADTIAGKKGPTPPSAAALRAETEPPPAEAVIYEQRSGSDYMVDVIKALDLHYVAALPGSSFRGLHESLIDYGGNSPELLTCLHEEISVALAHGYAKIAGKPMGVFIHSVVGLQHAAMAIYNAWCDRVPVVMFVGATLDATKRREGTEWDHSALDGGALVRDFVKWDAQPTSLQDFNDSLLRAYELAVSPPFAPVLISVDSELQERPIAADLKPTPRLSVPRYPVGDPAALAEAAALLSRAEHPVIVVDRLVRTPQGMAELITLAESLQCPVVERRGRLNIPNTHPLNQTEDARSVLQQADVVLALEVNDPWGVMNTLVDRIERNDHPVTSRTAKLVTVSTHDALIHSNYQDFERYQPADLAISGDGEASLPYLIEAVRRSPPSQAVLQARAEQFRQAHGAARAKALEEARYGWDASPVTTARMCSELWPLIKDSDWAFVGANQTFQSSWPARLWEFDKPYQYAGEAGGAGVGYGAPAAVGAALAHRDHGRLAVNIQPDGELMCAPGALWTAVHHKIPLLTVMHNNRAYHQEVMHIQRMAGRHARGVDRARIGTAIDDPAIDYAKLAGSMGMQGFGPVTDPDKVGPTLKRAVEIVKRGEPVMVDIVCQPR